ncbi:MAG: alpha/beta fold hydrolase [Pseudomonadota bacterium]
MASDPHNPEINTRVYDFCVRAFRTTKKLLKLNIKLHQDDENTVSCAQQGDIFLFNHFARFETFIPQYLIHEATGAYCRSVASSEFFKGDERFSQFLYSIGAVPNDLPNLFPFLAAEILHGRKLVVFPEGGMVKDKRVVDHSGNYNVFSRSDNERRKHHRGSAVIALAVDAFKTALRQDYASGKHHRLERWAEQLGFDSVEALMVRADKPTIVVPSHITFYPIRVSDNILHQAAQLFSKGINRRFAEELVIEGNMLFKHTDIDIRFSQPITIGNYWRWWERRLLPNVVNRFESLNELFELKPRSGHWGGRIHSYGMKIKSNQVRDDSMRSMYRAVTINLSHIASHLILKLFQRGLRQINCGHFHKMLYLSIKKIQHSEFHLHRSLRNPEEYGAIVGKGSTRLDQFLKTSTDLELVHVEDGAYHFDKKLIEDFEFDEIRTENLISVYANEISPLVSVTHSIEKAMVESESLDSRNLAEFRLDDQRIALAWDSNEFNKPAYEEINNQQTQNSDANWFFMKSDRDNADAVLLIHGFLSGPEEMRSLGERLHAEGHHVLGIRLKGHGTSPWDLRSRNWRDWAKSVEQGYEIIKAYSQSVHIVGFSTGGLLALYHAACHPHVKIRSVSSVCAPVDFRNKNLVFVPILHHANRLVSWANSEGLIPFRPNETENPDVNYQHIPIRALYQLQKFINHIEDNGLTIAANVNLYQGDEDPVVDPESVHKLEKLIQADNISLTLLKSDRHGVVYRNIDEVQQKICASIG